MEILKHYPSMTYLIHKLPQVIVHHVIEEMGYYKGYKVSKVGVEIMEAHEVFGEKKYD